MKQLPEPRPKTFLQQVEDVLDDMFGRVWRLALVIALVSIPLGTGLAFWITSARQPSAVASMPHAPWPETVPLPQRAGTPVPIEHPVIMHNMELTLKLAMASESMDLVNGSVVRADPGSIFYSMYLTVRPVDDPIGMGSRAQFDSFVVLSRTGGYIKPVYVYQGGLSALRDPESMRPRINSLENIFSTRADCIVLIYQIEDVPHDVYLVILNDEPDAQWPILVHPYPHP
jgi:hypothetical protein